MILSAAEAYSRRFAVSLESRVLKHWSEEKEQTDQCVFGVGANLAVDPAIRFPAEEG